MQASAETFFVVDTKSVPESKTQCLPEIKVLYMSVPNVCIEMLNLLTCYVTTMVVYYTRHWHKKHRGSWGGGASALLLTHYHPPPPPPPHPPPKDIAHMLPIIQQALRQATGFWTMTAIRFTVDVGD